MDNQENKDSSYKADSELERHNLTVNGQAEAIGMIAVNSANPDTNEHSHEEKKKKEQATEEWLLADEIAKLQEYLDELNERIDAGTLLLDAYKNGERDFDSVEHLHLLEVTGWTREDILEGRAENMLADLKTESAGLTEQIELFEEMVLSEDKPANEDAHLKSSIKTSIDLQSAFKNAVEDNQPEVNTPSIIIPAPGATVGF